LSDTNELTDQIKNIRSQTLPVIDDLAKKGKEYELSDPPTALEAYRLKLLDNTYNVLVVGEMKRGKSSFVNALIGRDILPTNVDIATCEVFRVSRADQEGYHLRFEDGTAREIAASDLKKYGEQGMRDVGEAPRLDQIIRWIEVDLPSAEFLPKGVNFMDTPGLGSLYAAHGQITQRFVPQADSVIFILDSEKPIIQSEIEFIGKILDVTHNIFFVLTKIDLYDDEHLQVILQRDEFLLGEKFKDRLTEMKIWPFSSAILRQATKTGDTFDIEVSCYYQLASALQAFLFRTSGLGRCTDALLIADHYQTVSRNVLASRLAALEAKTTLQLDELRQSAIRREEDFDAEWGVKGRQRAKLLSNVQEIVNLQRRSFISILESSNTFEKAQRHKIDEVKSIEEARKLGETFSEDVVTEIMNKWRSVREESRLQCAALLAPLIEAVDTLILPNDEPYLATHVITMKDLSGDIWDKFGKAQSDFLKAGGVSANAVLIALRLYPASVLPLLPIAVPAVIAAGIWAAIRGWKTKEQTQLKEAQRELNEHLTSVFTEVRERFLLQYQYNGQNLVDNYFNTLINAFTDQIQEIAEVKLEEARTASNRLIEQASLDEHERKAKAEQAQQQLTKWDAIGEVIEGIVTDLKVLDRLILK
jgi:GTPase SAR1 family protein